jgi:hypothetical protein
MWTPPSTALLVDIRALVDEYCLRALLQLCTKLDPNAYASFKKFMVNKVTATIAELAAKAQVSILTSLNNEQFPSTFNHYLNENIQKLRNERQLLQLSQLKDNQNKLDYALVMAIFERSQRQSIEEYAAQELSFILRSYSKVASKRVMDDIPNIIEANFVQVSVREGRVCLY